MDSKIVATSVSAGALATVVRWIAKQKGIDMPEDVGTAIASLGLPFAVGAYTLIFYWFNKMIGKDK